MKTNSDILCPSWLEEEAKIEWKRLAAELISNGKLPIMNQNSFAGYCQSYARWKEAEEFITKHGIIYKDHNSNVKAVPQVAIAQQNLKLMKSFCNDFGFEVNGITEEDEL